MSEEQKIVAAKKVYWTVWGGLILKAMMILV